MMRSLLTGDESLQAPTHGIKPVAEAPDELELIEMLGALALRLALGAALGERPAGRIDPIAFGAETRRLVGGVIVRR